MKNRSIFARLASSLVLASVALSLTACGVNVIYKDPQYNYSGRPIPPSNLLQRVMASYTANGSSGGLEILDGNRDLRGNVENTIKFFNISGYSSGLPTTIFNFPEQTRGYVLSASDGGLTAIDYSKEASTGAVASYGANPPSVAVAPTGTAFAGASEQSGNLIVASNGSGVALSLPNVYKVSVNTGANVILAMVRNSNTLYRVIKLPATSNPVIPPGSVDCEPLLLPSLCVVPVSGTYDRPSNVSFSLDGNTAYVLNCGPECGGTTASVTLLRNSALDINNLCVFGFPSAQCPAPTSPLAALPVANPVPVPGGATAALSDGTNLYLSGQSLLRPSVAGGPLTTTATDGLLTGYLTLFNLATYTVGNPISISDGSHSKMLFADDNTLWIGSQQCANGERAAVAQRELALTGATDQAGNYNCLTMVMLGAATPTAQIIPAVTQGPSPVQVAYPNTNENFYYYGSLTGLCWVQGFHKVYTAYGGQIHAFYTGSNTVGAPGAEINNYNITIQGTVLDVAYMDALTNAAN